MTINIKISILGKVVFIINLLQYLGIMKNVWTKYHLRLADLEVERIQPLMDEIKRNSI